MKNVAAWTVASGSSWPFLHIDNRYTWIQFLHGVSQRDPYLTCLWHVGGAVVRLVHLPDSSSGPAAPQDGREAACPDKASQPECTAPEPHRHPDHV